MSMPSGVSRDGRGIRFRHAVALFALIAGVLAAAGCDRSGAAPPPTPPPPAVTVAHPVEREVTDWDEYTGRLEAADSVDVRARVSGFLDTADFKEGSVVKAGQLLFVIDPRPFQAEVDRASAEVARAKAQVQQTTEEFARLEKIKAGAATERELLNARYNKAAADASLIAANAAMKAAGLNLDFTRVTAPIGGRVGRKMVTQGNLITGGGTAGPATLLTTITALDPIYLDFDADERAVLKYRLSRASDVKVRFGLAVETDFPHEGMLDFVNNRLDPATGTLQVRATVRNPDGLFTPGMFCRVIVPAGEPYHGTLVADEAVGSDQAQRFVLVVDGQNTVQYRPVTVGPLFGGMRVVKGVSPQEWVVVNGQMKARPGMKVDPKPAEMPERRGLGAAPATRPAAPQGATTQGTTRAATTQAGKAGAGAGAR